MSCDIDTRRDLAFYLFSGGTARAKGFKERFATELQKLTKTKVHINNEAQFEEMVWVGGSMLASLSTFQQMYIKNRGVLFICVRWISKEEYDESGPNYAYRCRPW